MQEFCRSKRQAPCCLTDLVQLYSGNDAIYLVYDLYASISRLLSCSIPMPESKGALAVQAFLLERLMPAAQ
jgi:hypothetical protein